MRDDYAAWCPAKTSSGPAMARTPEHTSPPYRMECPVMFPMSRIYVMFLVFLWIPETRRHRVLKQSRIQRAANFNSEVRCPNVEVPMSECIIVWCHWIHGDNIMNNSLMPFNSRRFKISFWWLIYNTIYMRMLMWTFICCSKISCRT